MWYKCHQRLRPNLAVEYFASLPRAVSRNRVLRSASRFPLAAKRASAKRNLKWKTQNVSTFHIRLEVCFQTGSIWTMLQFPSMICYSWRLAWANHLHSSGGPTTPPWACGAKKDPTHRSLSFRDPIGWIMSISAQLSAFCDADSLTCLFGIAF